MSFLDIFHPKKGLLEEKEIAKNGSDKQRLQLAKSKKTSPEILYYLAAHDTNKDVRYAVAHNTKTPVHASALLAKDKHVDVKQVLMERLIKLLPELSQDDQKQLYAHAAEALGTLALDEIFKIRKALSSALRDHAYAPPQVVSKLARDVERDISEPILRYCTKLPDSELMDILSAHPKSWTIQAIAARANVKEPVTGAIIDLNDRKAGLVLLENSSAQISTKTYNTIVDKARDFPEWHKPLAVRKHLPKEAARELASFISASVRKSLFAAQGFDRQEVREITEIVERRLNLLDAKDEGGDSTESLVQKLFKKGALSDKIIQDAIGLGDDIFVILALSALANISTTRVREIISMAAPKSITALCWKAGLSMRTSYAIQRDLAKIPNKALLLPKDGTDYPLTTPELKWQLDFLDL